MKKYHKNRKNIATNGKSDEIQNAHVIAVTDKNSTLRTPVCFYVLRGGTYPVNRQIGTRRNGLFEPLNRVEIVLFAKFRNPIRRVRRFVVGIIVCYVKRAISRRTTRDLKLTLYT